MKFWFFLAISFCSCNTRYSGGNVGSICEIQTNLKLKTIKQISDSLFKEGSFAVPADLRESIDLEEYSFLDHRDYYFENNPRQIYVVTFDGNLLIRMIYDVNTKEWLTRESKLTERQIHQIKNRFNHVLELVKRRAELDVQQDSVVYSNRGGK